MAIGDGGNTVDDCVGLGHCDVLTMILMFTRLLAHHRGPSISFCNVHVDEDDIVFYVFHGDADADLNFYQVVGTPQAEELFHVDVLNIMLMFTKLLAHHSQRSSFSEFFL